ncbi:MAG: biotin--[acetyl-CoA-carboxylase] ligase [Planctomycetota bacterium]
MLRVSRVLLDTIDSTNDEAWRRLERAGAAAGLVVVAFEQTSGRGRTGPWSSPRGASVALSAVLPRGSFPTVAHTMIGALAAHDATARHDLRDIAIKWPNDVLVAGRKIAGVLVESRTSCADVVVIGIGLNVAQSRADLAAQGLSGATSLRAEGIEQSAAAAADRLVADLLRWHETLAAHGFGPVAAVFAARLKLLGERCVVQTATGEATGRLIDLTRAGEIVIETASGARRAFRCEHVQAIRRDA